MQEPRPLTFESTTNAISPTRYDELRLCRRRLERLLGHRTCVWTRCRDEWFALQLAKLGKRRTTTTRSVAVPHFSHGLLTNGMTIICGHADATMNLTYPFDQLMISLSHR
jgi:hypothetical protein